MKRIMPWHAGEEGLTFEPKSVDEIVDTLEKLWLDDGLCKILAGEGKERAKYFLQERFQKAIAKVLESK